MNLPGHLELVPGERTVSG